jgi:hypothetical protein
MYMARMKNDVAPMVCAVQSMSLPSEIVLVDRHKNRQQAMDNGPKCLTLSYALPVISKLLIMMKFLHFVDNLLEDLETYAKQDRRYHHPYTENNILRVLDGSVGYVSVGEGGYVMVVTSNQIRRYYGDGGYYCPVEREHTGPEAENTGFGRLWGQKVVVLGWERRSVMGLHPFL